jgi:tRNA uridine 5-carboxymethylaminomethyl modification enzyme
LKEINEALIALQKGRIEQQPAEGWLKRPEFTWEDIVARVPELSAFSIEAGRQIEYDLKYAGYVARQQQEVERNQRLAVWRIPRGFDYRSIVSMRTEARQKLTSIQPESIEQAGRISGITPADLAILIAHIDKP